MTERHVDHRETLSNGCRIEVKAQILKDGSLLLLVNVNAPNGKKIVEDYAPELHNLDMEAAMDLAIGIARSIGNGQRTL